MMRVLPTNEDGLLYISHTWGKGAALVENFTLRLSDAEIRDLEKIIHAYNEKRIKDT